MLRSKKEKKLALELGIQTYQIFTNDYEVCIPSLSSILLAEPIQWKKLQIRNLIRPKKHQFLQPFTK